MARHRLLMLLGWAALVGGPAAGWLAARRDAAAVAYGASPAGWPGVAAALVPSVAAGALLLLNGGLRARGRARSGAWAPGAADRALVAASVVAGWACAAASGLALLTAMIFGGPLGIIGGAGLLLVLFSFVGRGKTPAPGYRANAGRPSTFEDPRAG